MSQPLRVAIYARVSTDDKGQDVQNQLLELKEFIEFKSRDGWTLVKEYCDEVSGKTSDRANFNLMFQDASQRKFDLLLFWSMDRFSREGPVKTFAHLSRLKDQGIDWWSYKEEYLRTIGIFSNAIIAILATVAEMERLRLSDRTKAGMKRAAKIGTKSGKAIGRPKTIIDVVKVLEMHKNGKTLVDIAKYYNTSYFTIRRAVRKYTQKVG